MKKTAQLLAGNRASTTPRAILVHEDGRRTIVRPQNPALGFQRDEIAKLIGAKWLEFVSACAPSTTGGPPQRTGMLLVLDEEGKMHDRAVNQAATEILLDECGGLADDYVVGKALWVAEAFLETWSLA